MLDPTERSELLALVPAVLLAKEEAPKGMLEYLASIMGQLNSAGERRQNLNDLLESLHGGLRQHYSLSQAVYVGASPKNLFDGETIAERDGWLILLCTGTFQLIEAATNLLEARRPIELKAEQLRSAIDEYVSRVVVPPNRAFTGSFAEFDVERHSFFVNLTSSTEVFVILHEYGHIAHDLRFGSADDELAADDWALARICARPHVLAHVGVFVFLGLGLLIEDCDRSRGSSITHTHPGARIRIAHAAMKLSDRLSPADRALVFEFLTLIDLAAPRGSTAQPSAVAIFEAAGKANLLKTFGLANLLGASKVSELLVATTESHLARANNATRTLPPGLNKSKTEGVYEFTLPSGRLLEMVRVPAGSFLFGPRVDPGYPSLEHTCIRVDSASRIDCGHDYFIGRYPTLVQEYRDYCDAIGKHLPEPATWRASDRHPITNMTLNEAEGFCRWANLTLPTEVEWEKAVRGTEGRILPWRDSWSTVGHIEFDAPPEANPSEGTASPFGVQHALGGVWEMTSDWLEGENPWSAQYRVLRGGSYRSDPACRTVLVRHRVTSRTFVREEIGFRVVLRIPQTSLPDDWRDAVLPPVGAQTQAARPQVKTPTAPEQADASRLFEACRHPLSPEQTAIVRDVVNRWSNAVHWVDKEGYTPLLRLTTAPGLPLFEESVEIATILVTKGANVNAQTSEGCTCFHVLASRAQMFALEVACVLLSSDDVDLSVRDKNGETAEMAAKRWVQAYGENYLALLTRRQSRQ